MLPKGLVLPRLLGNDASFDRSGSLARFCTTFPKVRMEEAIFSGVLGCCWSIVWGGAINHLPPKEELVDRR